MTAALTVGSLFSGIGGLDLGLERAGMTVRWQVENNPFCAAVLARHWPDVTRHGDIKELDPDALEPVDLVAGGFPCPPVSSAGLRRGRADHRWLWPHFARVLRSVRPRFVLLENVTGLLQRDEFGDVLADLHTLGFDADWSVVPACALGASHARERVFLLAHRPGDDEQGQGALHAGQGGLRAEPRGGRGPTRAVACRWLPEPPVGRVADGVPYRLVRPALSAFGNAVVPDVAEHIGRRLMAVAA